MLRPLSWSPTLDERKDSKVIAFVLGFHKGQLIDGLRGMLLSPATATISALLQRALIEKHQVERFFFGTSAQITV